MLALCTMLGLLCVPPQYVPVTKVSLGPVVAIDALDKFDEAQSKRRGITVFSWRSDNIQSVSSMGLDRACAGQWCVYYRKHCHDTVCEYVTSEPVENDGSGLIFASGLEIQAPTKAALRRLIGALRFVLKVENGKTLSVPLSFLSRESPDLTHMRGCMRSIWVQGCPRPSAPELRHLDHP